ncbi:MAG: TIGR02099 family protein [Bacteriovorax sp.]|nr:TIGR02099 family protein [Rhizobacter sp.]
MRFLVGAVIVIWSVLLVAWLALHWWILPHIEQWRGPIEMQASRALGVPLRIGQIEVRSSGWVPSVELREVQLLDAQQRTALRLPRVFAAISPRSLLSFELRFEQLLIDGAELDVRRDASGRIFVAGFDSSGPEQDSAAADWFFKQREVVIRGGSLRWTDEQRQAAPLALADVQLVFRNGLRNHEMRLDATPPADWGDRFIAIARFTQPLLARGSDWRRWSGEAYASLPRADVHALRQHLNLPFELSEGIGALRGWFAVKDGQPNGATVDIALRDVSLRLARNVEALRVDELEGRLLAQRNADGVTLAVQRFTFLTGDAIRWPQGDMKLSWRQRDGEPPAGGEFSAQRLDVGQMAQVAAHVPFGDALQRLLAELNPKGVISDLDARWDGPLDAPLHYRARGNMSGLSLASHAAADAKGVGRPGLRNASLQLDATEAGGEARIGMNGGAVELPGVFDEPLVPFDQLSAKVVWRIEPVGGALPRVTVQVRDARFSNADAKGELTASWVTGPGTGTGSEARLPGRLELDARLTDGVAQRAYRYLPRGLSQDTRSYIEHAALAGRIANASFHVKGKLSDFPFRNAGKLDGKNAKNVDRTGEFRINSKIEDATYAYIPGTPASGALPASPSTWPVLTRASAELNLERGVLEVRNGRAQVGNVAWSNVQVAVRNLDSEPVLSLDGAARGPLAEMIQFVNVTPVGGWIGNALATSTGGGQADLKFGLVLPLMQRLAATVKGSVTMAGNDLRIAADSPLLGNAKGRVDFTTKGFAVVGASARMLGGDLSFEGGAMPDGSVRLNGQGVASAEGLRRASEFGQLARIAGALSGQAAYRTSLGFVRGVTELTVTSNLVGMAVNLPAPLAKAADVPLAMRYQNSLDPASLVAGQTLRDTLRFELGTLVQAQYQRDISTDVPRVLRGGVGVMEPAPQPAVGVAASVNLKSLATDEWEAVADKLVGPADPRDARETPDASAKAGYAPDTIALRVQDLNVGSRRLTHVVAGVSQDAGTWRANVDADQLNGYVEYRPPAARGAPGASGSAGAAGRVYARLSRLSLPKSDVEQVESLLDQQPASVPALDVVVEDFELRGKRLGRVEVEAVNRVTGQGRDALRDWQLSKFNITTPEAQLTASGHWSAVGAASPRGAAQRRAVMDFKLVLADSGALLDQLGTPKVIRGGKGQLSGQVGWLGSPLALDTPSLSGQVNVAIEAGQFLKADPGAARLLGVLNLQSLPRRLSLDFRDLFQEGFAFDNVTGDLTITQGVAQTNNLRMRGVQAAVLMEGHADIARETQDLRVIVVPEINAGTAALAYAVINPAIGLGAFLAQALLKKPLTAAGTREFHVSGPWADPQVEPVKRKLTDEVPSVDAPASSPAPAKNP